MHIQALIIVLTQALVSRLRVPIALNHIAEAGIVMLDSSFVEPSSVSSLDLESDIYSCPTQSENSSGDWQYSW